MTGTGRPSCDRGLVDVACRPLAAGVGTHGIPLMPWSPSPVVHLLIADIVRAMRAGDYNDLPRLLAAFAVSADPAAPFTLRTALLGDLESASTPAGNGAAS